MESSLGSYRAPNGNGSKKFKILSETIERKSREARRKSQSAHYNRDKSERSKRAVLAKRIK